MRIIPSDVQAWCEKTKTPISEIDINLEEQLETQILATLEAGFNVSSWVDFNSTPPIIRSIFAMKYASMYYDRQYSEESDTTDPYAAKLDLMAQDLIDGILSGSVTIDGYLLDTSHASPETYPTDSSSVNNPQRGFNVQYGEFQIGDPSLGGPKFSMGSRF